ncbi:hypothetical protein VNI00_006189 [Paramarasmius palmivorus]|uniref:SHSP domain-containing protein n=1 Tax=Paramarasmius palmivorus TaxID=297713 RepID=A0AAW0D523_9AGAR
MDRPKEWIRRFAMSYPYPHGSHGQQGQYHHDDYSTPSTPQYPQWEVLDTHSQLEPEVLTPTQQMHSTPQQLFAPPPPTMTMDVQEHQQHQQQYIPPQLSPVEPPPVLVHRHSYEATSDGGPSPDLSDPSRPTTSTSQPTHISRRAPPLRRSPSARSQNRVNPYPRPHSALGHPIVAPVAGPSGRIHRVEESDPNVRYTTLPPRISTSSAGPSTAVATSPASATTPRVMSHGLVTSGTSPFTTSSMLPPTTPTSAGGPILQRQVQGGLATTGATSALSRARRFIIRSDIQYDPQTHVLTASMEIPGVKKAQLSITLSTCLINRVKQVVVSGRTSPVFPPPSSSVHFNMGGGPATGSSMAGGRDGSGALTSSSGGGGAVSEHDGTQLQHNVRERKYGEFTRTLPVPSETKIEDIDAALEDGILTLKICLGPPAESADVQVVPIR